MIREQYSALKTEDKEKLFKENFPELPAEQRQNFEEALLNGKWQNEKKSNNIFLFLFSLNSIEIKFYLNLFNNT